MPPYMALFVKCGWVDQKAIRDIVVQGDDLDELDELEEVEIL